MKKVIVIMCIAAAGIIYPQWEWQNPFPAGGTLGNVQFINSNIGWASGSWGVLIKTTDGGSNWETILVDDITSYIYEIHFFDENIGFLAAGTKLLKTTDGGSTWEVNLVPSLGYISTISFYNKDIGYAGGTKVYKTTNGGDSWTASNKNFNDFYELYIVDENTITTVGYDDANRSTDGGVTWTTILKTQYPAEPYTSYLGIHFINNDTGFVVGNPAAIWKTTDSGVTWDTSYYIITGEKMGSDISSVFFTSNTKGFAVGSYLDYHSSPFKHYSVILKTIDCGENWTLLPPISNHHLEKIYFFDSLNGIIVGENGIIITTNDGGENWTLKSRLATSDTLTSIFVINTLAAAAVGYNGTIIHTSDGGGMWILQNSGVSADLNSVAFADLSNGIAAGNSGTIVFTTNGGITWNKFQYPDNSRHFTSVSYIKNSNTAYAGGSGLLIKTTDKGLNWNFVNEGTFFNSVWFFNENTGFAAGNGVKKTTNGGNNWNDMGLQGTFRYITFSDENFGAVADEEGTIYVTTNGGSSWEQRSISTPMQVFGISITESNYLTVLLGSSSGGNNFSKSLNPGNNRLAKTESQEEGYIYRSTDGGLTWTVQHLPGYYMTGTGHLDKSTGYLVGLSGSIIKTSDAFVPVELASFTASVNGNEIQLNWQTATETNNKGFEVQRKHLGAGYKELTFIPGYGTISEPSMYSYEDKNLDNGIYTYRLKQIDYDGTFSYSDEIEAAVDILPEEYSLKQNYPNPFNPVTKIKFSIPVNEIVEIKIYDILGNEIEVFLKEELPAGTYEREWNGTGKASGVYNCRLTAGKYTENMKMILLK